MRGRTYDYLNLNEAVNFYFEANGELIIKELAAIYHISQYKLSQMIKDKLTVVGMPMIVLKRIEFELDFNEANA